MTRRGALPLALLALYAGALLLAPPAAAAHGLAPTRASAVKAAFLYKFGSFVEWPARAFHSNVDPVVMGVYGDEAVAAELEQITQGRNINGRPLVVRRVRDADKVAGVHILYAGGARKSRAREVIAAADGPVLTVSDFPGDGRFGPVLHFTEDEGRVRFQASLTAAEARGIRLSARLLAVAQEVEGR